MPPRALPQNAMLFKAVFGLFTLLILQLGAITGLVRLFSVDVAVMHIASGFQPFSW